MSVKEVKQVGKKDICDCDTNPKCNCEYIGTCPHWFDKQAKKEKERKSETLKG